jgi:hypothetical protein
MAVVQEVGSDTLPSAVDGRCTVLPTIVINDAVCLYPTLRLWQLLAHSSMQCHDL